MLACSPRPERRTTTFHDAITIYPSACHGYACEVVGEGVAQSAIRLITYNTQVNENSANFFRNSIYYYCHFDLSLLFIILKSLNWISFF